MPVPKTGLSELTWKKARRSMANGDCVEVAFTGGRVYVRDSKSPGGDILACAPAVWSQFLATVKLGLVDLPRS